MVPLLPYFASNITRESCFSVTGDKVLIVIGGDDSYKDENEEDTAFISRWAKRKISSQFSEELIDGRKSFIFSWNQKHRPIHEEALVHFLDERKRGEKFEYHPKGKSSQVAETAMSRKADASTWERDPWGKKSTRGRNGSDATSQGTSASGDKPTERDTYPGASPGKGVTENRTPHTGKDDSSRQVGGSHPQGGIASFQRNASSMGNTPFQTRKEGSSRVNESNSPVGFDPLRSDTSRKASSSSGSTTPHSGNKGRFGRTGECDYSVESDPLERGTFGNSWSGIYPSLCSDTTGTVLTGFVISWFKMDSLQ